MRFKFSEDEAGVAINVAADGEDRNAAVVDTRWASKSVRIFWYNAFGTLGSPYFFFDLPKSADVVARKHRGHKALRIWDTPESQVPHNLRDDQREARIIY